ncbi:hypothetical protein [uncultured Pseudoteredinibacter sp.]|uniref:hypothetical protein n=1 Tax=uncultured Pseudoteredinibacter sp. TaxID=1641701 RepID=UPI002612F999|nr:hypothetical protein [uncultured Pseudoteredinibacter sp.]
MIRDLNVVEVEQVSGGFNHLSSNDNYDRNQSSWSSTTYNYGGLGFGDEKETPPDGEGEKPKESKEKKQTQEDKRILTEKICPGGLKSFEGNMNVHASASVTGGGMGVSGKVKIECYPPK